MNSRPKLIRPPDDYEMSERTFESAKAGTKLKPKIGHGLVTNYFRREFKRLRINSTWKMGIMNSGHMKSAPAKFVSDVRPGTSKRSDDNVSTFSATDRSEYSQVCTSLCEDKKRRETELEKLAEQNNSKNQSKTAVRRRPDTRPVFLPHPGQTLAPHWRREK